MKHHKIETMEQFNTAIHESAIELALKYLNALDPETAAEAIRRFQSK